MERTVIERLRPCVLSSFGGNTWTVSIENLNSLEGTILDFLVHPERQLVWELNGVQILLPQMRLEERILRTKEGVYLDKVVDLPDDLQVFDLQAVGIDKERDFSWKVKRIILQQLSKHLSQGVYNIRADMPGFMNVVLPAPSTIQPGEVAVSKKSIAKILRNTLLDKDNDIFRELVYSRCPHFKETIEQKLKESVGEKSKFNHKEQLDEIALSLSGCVVFCTRYPISGANSHSLMTLRVFENCPTEAVYINLQTLVREKYGDCDGDSINFYFTYIPEMNQPARQDKFTWKLNKTYKLPSLDEVWNSRQSEDKDPLQIMKGFDQRALYIGMLTYLYWLLAYCCVIKKVFWDVSQEELYSILPKSDIEWFMKNNTQMTKEQRKWRIMAVYSVRVCQNWFTPLIEGVMNARKEDNFETNTGKTLAQIVVELLTGKENIISGVKYIPVRPDDSPFDEEKLTRTQHKDLVKALNRLSDGKGKVNLSTAVSDLGHALVSSRFDSTKIERVLSCLHTKDRQFMDTIFGCITLEESFEIPLDFFVEIEESDYLGNQEEEWE